MKIIWYFSIILLLLSILLSHPQKGSLGTLNSDIKILSPTSNTQKGLQVFIMINISIFFLLTIFVSINSQIYY